MYVFFILSKMADDMDCRFEAAVNVIRSLPKKGSYQPPYETMLKFYGYFKQAKEGECTNSKPGFWDVVNKAKWEAWSALGDLSKKEAMKCYINELKKVMETMPDTEEMADFSLVLKSFYETVYEPDGEEPPHILRIFKKPVLVDDSFIALPEKCNGYGHSKDITVTTSQSFIDDESAIFQDQNVETSLENVSKIKEPQSTDKTNGGISADVQNGSNYNSNTPSNGLSEAEEISNDVVNLLEDTNDNSTSENLNGSDLYNASSLHDVQNTNLQPKPLYIVEVSSNKKGLPQGSEDSKDLFNVNVQNSQPGFPQSNMKGNGQPEKLSPGSDDDSEDEEFCDSLDPEHLSVLQSGMINTPEVTLSKLNAKSDPDTSNSSASTSSPDHLPGSSLTESDMSDLDNEVLVTAQRYTSTPFEKKPVHVTFDIKENPKTKSKSQDSKGSRGESIDEPQIVPNTSHGVKASSHHNGGILKVKQAGSGYGGGDASKSLRQPPLSSGYSQSTRQQGASANNADNSIEDSRMIPRRNESHSDSDSDDTNPNGESCDSCGERDEINERIMIALERLQQDMSRVLRRLETMEDVMALRQERLHVTSRFHSKYQSGPWWSQFLPSKTVAFLVLWPFAINLVFYYLRKRKARKS